MRVVKLGGSLLDLSDLGVRFRSWLAMQPHCPTLVVVGGGRVVEAVRSYDQLHTLPTSVSHWLAIESMSFTARLAQRLLDVEGLVASVREIQAFSQSPGFVAVCDVLSLLRELETEGDHLPIGWQTTSDSIAAYFARRLNAAELVLLKSTPIEGDESLEQLAARGLVDEAFPEVALGLRWRWVNVRKYESTIELQQ